MKGPSQEKLREMAEEWLRGRIPAEPGAKWKVSIPSSGFVQTTPGAAFVEAVVEIPLDGE